MASQRKKIKIGIVGCGAIGSRIAQSVIKDLKSSCVLSGLYDIDQLRSRKLEKKVSRSRIIKTSLKDLLKSSQLMIEAVSAQNTRSIIRQALLAKKDVLAMSVGKLLEADSLFKLAHKNGCVLLLPSGAIAGLDAVKAARLGSIKEITLTTRKPPAGLADNPYLMKQGINLSKIRKETLIFDGGVEKAVRCFPKNINVAATLALASQAKNKMRVRILTSPQYTTNSHEIEVLGKFGRIATRTDNYPCPDNPKTSYLAVLSGIQTLKQYVEGLKIGT